MCLEHLAAERILEPCTAARAQQRNQERAQRQSQQQPQGQRVGHPAKHEAQTPQLNKHEAKQQSQGASRPDHKQESPGAGGQGHGGGKGKGKGKP